MSNKKGLGKGLSALIPMETRDEGSVQEISLSDIHANLHQPRRNFDEEKILELAASIREHGVIQPIILRKDVEGYEIVAGERRWRASIRAGLRKIPAIVKELTDIEVIAVALIENLQREDLNPIEEALAYRRLMKEFELTQEDLSKQLGKSRSRIANSVRLLNLEQKIQNHIVDGDITAGHARALLSIEDGSERLNLADTIIKDSMSVRQVEEFARNKVREKEKTEKRHREINPVLIDITERLQRNMGTRVRIKGNEKRGRIEIEFYSSDELERIIEYLNI